MTTKKHIFILGVLFSMLFIPAFISSVHAGYNCNDFSCSNETACNNDCNERVSTGCHWDGDSCEIGRQPESCSECLNEQTCVTYNSYTCDDYLQSAGGCIWDDSSRTCKSPPKPVTLEECMFVGTDNAYECFCSGNGKNFFKIECTQERFDFCVYDALGEVKRLLVVGDTTIMNSQYSLDLECSNLAFCGNTVKELDEECDTGMSAVSGDCANTEFCNVKNGCVCETDTCGNGIVGNNEECDDGNLTDGDGCDSNCTYTACGNGIATAGEECDDGNLDETDACANDCTLTFCGDNIVQMPNGNGQYEQCEFDIQCDITPMGSESPDEIVYECYNCRCEED